MNQKQTLFHDLHLRLPLGLWQAVQDRASRSDESAAHVIRQILAEAFELEHHTLWQLSTSTAVVQGVFQGSLQVRDLFEHGDFGIGTFDKLDGEGILLDGDCWQARADGSLTRAPDEELIPFWIATHFHGDNQLVLEDVSDFEELGTQLDLFRPSANLFMAIRIKGHFERIVVRSVSKVETGIDLVSAANQQSEFVHHHLPGMLVGFWSPEYARSFNIPGYHFHFISDDRRHGGHLLELQAQQLQVELQIDSDLRLALPQTREFLEADLTKDPLHALNLAERQGSSEDTEC